MNEPHPQDLQEILASRLLRRAEFDEIEELDEERGSPQETVQQPVHQEPIAALELPATTFAKVEKSLISLGFFTPSSSRIKGLKVKRISFTRNIDGKKIEATAEIHPSAVLGLPITADQDKLLALNNIITALLKHNGTVENPIRFTSAELLRLLNKRVRTGKNYKDISEWLDVMTSTTIVSHGVVYEAGKQRFARDRFHVFERAVNVGKELPDGTIADANYVWLSEWQLENINRKFLVPIDLLVYRDLKNHIAKALVPLLQVWLYASQRAGSFEKRYDDLCEMLSLKVYKAPSRITQQLKASLDELTQYGYLDKWRIERTADKQSLKIILVHGPKFHRDRRRRLAEKLQAEAPIVVAESETVQPSLPEPGRLSTQSESTRMAAVGKNYPGSQEEPVHPLESGLVEQLSARGLMPSAAQQLLRAIPAERLLSVGDYIDYWDVTKRTKAVGEGLLYSLIKAGDPLPMSFETRRQREEHLERQRRNEDLRRLQDEMKVAYEDHCETMLDLFIAEELGQEEFQKRVDERKSELLQQGGFFDGMNKPEIIARLAATDVRRSLVTGVVVSYDEFYRRRLPAVIEKPHLDAADVGFRWVEDTSQGASNGSLTDEENEPSDEVSTNTH